MKKIIALVVLVLYAPFGFACTTFLLSKDTILDVITTG
jgi:hypothetical protein